CDFWTNISREKWGFSYADGKWTIKQLFQHVIDTERILAFRALSIARKELNPLSSFDENEYAKNGNAINRDPKSMIQEYIYLRKSTNYLYSSFNDYENKLIGKAGDKKISVNALGFIIIGHSLHHINICKKYYGL
ncbi:MAG: DinB family protein, partial [Flavobacteriales bacterium]|nr:DinB family protein [Flavobacteriales bacterium]